MTFVSGEAVAEPAGARGPRSAGSRHTTGDGWTVPEPKYESHAGGMVNDAIAPGARAVADVGPAPSVSISIEQGPSIPPTGFWPRPRTRTYLLVSRGHAGLVGLPLGSVSPYCITFAADPVVVVCGGT